MTSTTPAARPTQVSLPGQTHVAHGPHDQTGMYLMHHAFRRDLTRFESAVRATPVGDAATWEALADRWQRFATVLHHHHTVEDDAIWPVLVRHAEEAGDTEGLGTLHAMEAEHATIDPALAACAAGFEQMRSHPCTDHRNALDVHVTALRRALLDHMRHEETDALPLLQRTMTAEEFQAAEKAAQRGYPARLVPFLVSWVMVGLPPEGLAALQPQLTPVHHLLLRLTGRRFRRGEQAAFRYAG